MVNSFSMEPKEFLTFCEEVKCAWKMLENPIDKNDIDLFTDMKKTFEKSLVSACKIENGTKIKLKHLSFKKPGDGIPASHFSKIIGLVASRNIDKNEKLSMKDFL